MKRVFVTMLCLIPLLIQAQQSTIIRFEDKNGLKDSITVMCGLTEEQINSISVFTEDQMTQAWQDSSSHWVWMEMSNYGEESKYGQTYIYIPYYGYVEAGKKSIIFPADRLPVTITWNKQFFNDNNLNGSVMSDMDAWFDCMSSDEELMTMLSENETCTLHNTSSRKENDWGSYKYIGDVFVKFFGLSVGTTNNLSESINHIQSNKVQSTKFFRDGQLLIECNGKTYNAQGMEAR